MCTLNLQQFNQKWLLLLSLITATLSNEGSTDLVSIYFGCGCFWHVQHEFVQAERRILNRSNDSAVNLPPPTALAGYAGATEGGNYCYFDGKVTAEVVGMDIPRRAVREFATVYFNLFNGMDRSHSNDKGPHYRAVIGLPDGLQSSLMDDINLGHDQSNAVPFEFKEGKGDDADTLGTNTIWVYDSKQFPFQQAEIFHQFHDDYLPSGQYDRFYNLLRTSMACSGKIVPTSCAKDEPALYTNLACNLVGLTENQIAAGGSGQDALTAASSDTDDEQNSIPAISRAASSMPALSLVGSSLLWFPTCT